MKRFLAFILIACAIATCFSQMVSTSPKVRYMKIHDAVRPGVAPKEKPKMRPKVARATGRKGNIILNVNYDVPDSIAIAANAAAEEWSYRIYNPVPIYIDLRFEPYKTDVAMNLQVMYAEGAGFDGIPFALVDQYTPTILGDNFSGVSTISLNRNLNWNCDFSGNISSGYNVFTMVSRGIAMSLGFGSSIVEVSKDVFAFNAAVPYVFDTLIENGEGTGLTELEEGSAEMKDFVTSGDLYVKGKEDYYKLYAPAVYDKNQSLISFDVSGSLMSKDVGEKSVMYEIDQKTIDVLNKIGWDAFTANDDHPIGCYDIGINGIGSANRSHTFYLQNSNASITGYKWSFSLRNAEGEYDEISTSTKSEFEIRPVKNTGEYYINTDGDLVGTIMCQYVENGVQKNAYAFNIALELRPTIFGVYDTKIERTGQYTYYVTCTANYVGADYIRTELEEEYCSFVRVQNYYEPLVAHIKTGEVSSLYHTWLTVIAKNKYGADKKIIELKPTNFVPSKSRCQIENTGIEESQNEIVSDGNTSLEIYNLQGVLVYTGFKNDFNESMLRKGLYIVKETNNAIINTYKVVIR